MIRKVIWGNIWQCLVVPDTVKLNETALERLPDAHQTGHTVSYKYGCGKIYQLLIKPCVHAS